MKNQEKIDKMGKILEENNSGEFLIDMFILQRIQADVEDISDKKLKIKFEKFLEDTIKEFGERDLDEEAKIEFYCSSCQKFLPLDKKAMNRIYTPICVDCEKEENENDEEEEDFE